MTIVIVGAGQAGARTAEALRAAGYSGGITLLGDEPHLPYERPPLSKGLLCGECEEESAQVLPASFYADHRVELRLGVRVTAIDRARSCVELQDGGRVEYESLVLATGLRPRRIQGYDDSAEVLGLRTLDDERRLVSHLQPGRRVLILGGGFLGLELAASSRQLGCDVTVVERNDSLLYTAVAAPVGDHIAALHRSHGVKIVQGATVSALDRVEARSSTLRAVLSSGQTLLADVVIGAAGSLPNTELAEAAGLNVQDGIVVDQSGRTSDPRIYAVGDVARQLNPALRRYVRIESWQNALNQARNAAAALAKREPPAAEIPWFWSDQFTMNLQIVGYPHLWDSVTMHGDVERGRFAALYLHGGVVVGANLINCGRDVRLVKQWIGAGVRIDAASLACARDLKELQPVRDGQAVALATSPT